MRKVFESKDLVSLFSLALFFEATHDLSSIA